MNKNLVSLLIIIIGVAGAYGVWTYRYNEAIEHGFMDGYNDGNQTGVLEGYNNGFDDGYSDGYDSVFLDAKEMGRFDGNLSGYTEGHDDGVTVGYSEGYERGNITGVTEGYMKGIDDGSEGYAIRDPTYSEAIDFIESDDTDVLYKNFDYSPDYLLGYIRKNAYAEGFRILWVNVEMVEGKNYFTAFNTTDKGILFFSYRHDILMNLVLWEPCYSGEEWIKPAFDDRVTKIEFTP